MRRSMWVPAFCSMAAVFAASEGNSQSRPTVLHPLELSKRHLSCTVAEYAKWSRDLQHAASEYYPYALMSHNVYDDEAAPRYQIAGWKLEDQKENPKNGLAFDVYRRLRAVPGREEVVIAFRGTDDNLDWKANLAPQEPSQYREAFEYVSGFRSHEPKTAITVTGHSLGGGIALNMALRVAATNAVVFNTSPRAFFRDEHLRNRLVHVFEAGEVLGVGNRTILPLKMSRNHEYTPIKFDYLHLVDRYDPIAQHGIYPLSRGLLLTAMADDSQAARDAFMSNISAEMARKTKDKDCGRLYQGR